MQPACTGSVGLSVKTQKNKVKDRTEAEESVQIYQDEMRSPKPTNTSTLGMDGPESKQEDSWAVSSMAQVLLKKKK